MFPASAVLPFAASVLLLGGPVGFTMAHPGPGVSERLAQARAAVVQDLRLDLAFSLPASKADPIQGRVLLRFRLKDGRGPLALDFASGTVQAVRVGGREVPWKAEDGHVVLPSGSLCRGENEVEIRFTAGDGPLNRQDDFLYTLFVPARAREAFPCFDQPDLKARVTLRLDLPASWQAVANGAETSRETAGDRVRLTFAETQPLPTYLIAFAAGAFQVETAVRDGRTLRCLHREKDAAKFSGNREALFDLHAQALAWMERYTGIPYPFGKYDFALIPAFQFGGMEHPGAVLYKESALLLEASATVQDRLGRAELIAHETAHMWFGDLVTMRWFNDVWMKEVFAGFMASKIVNPAFPELNHDLRFLADFYPRAARVDRTPGANPIRQSLANLAEAGSLYGPIIYAKAPIVMRHLERLMGEEGLRAGLRAYLQGHAYGNADWPDLIAQLQRGTREDLGAWSEAWVGREGRPVVTTDLRLAEGRIAHLGFRQRDPRGRGLRWSQALVATLGYPDGTLRHLKAQLAGDRVEVPGAVGLPAPAFVLPNGQGLAYGDLELDPASRAWLLAHLPEVSDALARGSAWLALWEELLGGRVRPGDLADLGLAALGREADDQNRELLLEGLRSLFWEFADPGLRAALAPRLEGLLRAELAKAPAASTKAALFRTFRSVATTTAALTWLEALWARRETIPGLPLAERDEVGLAQDLALRGVAGWRAMLETQEARIPHADRRLEFAFLRPSLDADPAVRRAFFAGLKDPARRSREAWVKAGLGFLNHPLRAVSALPDLHAGLELLPEIQRTGDIFFPQGWVAGLLSGHASPEAEAAVGAFLAALPKDFPPRLRAHVEVELDRIRRCVRARGGAL